MHVTSELFSKSYSIPCVLQKGCKCTLFSSNFLCVVCDKHFEAHETVCSDIVWQQFEHKLLANHPYRYSRLKKRGSYKGCLLNGTSCPSPSFPCYRNWCLEKKDHKPLQFNPTWMPMMCKLFGWTLSSGQLVCAFFLLHQNSTTKTDAYCLSSPTSTHDE